jgi:hypothetical protein
MRTQLTKITLAAGFAFALAFTLNGCGNNDLFGDGGTKMCGGVEYNTSEFNCIGGELAGKCMGVDYYPAYQTCNNGVIEDKNPSSSSGKGGSSSSVKASSSSLGDIGTSSSSETISSSSSEETVSSSSIDVNSWYNQNPSATVFTINTADELAGFAQLVNGGNTFASKTVKLGKDIILNDTTGWKDWVTSPPVNSWTPIGTSSSSNFGGIFDGSGHIVGGVYINATTDNRGLFGYISATGIVKNVGLVASYLKGGNNVGGLIGYSNGGTITNSYSTSIVRGASYVGGLVGYNNTGSTVSNSYSVGAVNGTGNNVGGLAGYNREGMITNSHSTGAVNGTNEVGGLLGKNYGRSSTVSNSYSTGAVNGTGNNVGGLVGDNELEVTVSNSYSTSKVTGGNNVGGLVGRNYFDTQISNSYATGAVNGASKIGGLVGYNEYIASIRNSYSIGSVTGTTNVGGLVGAKESHSGNIVSGSYYNTETSGQSDTGKGTGKTTEEMKERTTFTGWNFDDFWGIGSGKNSGYPYLLDL